MVESEKTQIWYIVYVLLHFIFFVNKFNETTISLLYQSYQISMWWQGDSLC